MPIDVYRSFFPAPIILNLESSKTLNLEQQNEQLIKENHYLYCNSHHKETGDALMTILMPLSGPSCM